MSTPFSDCETKIREIFETYWTHDPNITVFWGDDWQKADVPKDAEAWISLVVVFLDETIRAFGAGRFANERAISGVVEGTVFGRAGQGLDDVTQRLDQLMSVFRSRRDGALSFVSAPKVIVSPPRFGVWQGLTAMIPFEWRFVG